VFAEVAAKLAGMAARHLSWSPNTFWNATPSELAACFASEDVASATPPSHAQIAAMIERDSHE